MYISYNGTNFPCKCSPGRTMRYRGLPDDFPAPVTGEIILCANDGFVMRKDLAEDYLRQTFEGGILTLTNEPEPVPADVPPTHEPKPNDETSVWEALDAAYREGVNDV